MKVTWEVNRLQFLTHICLQYRYSGERKYLQRFIDIITSWKEANPTSRGSTGTATSRSTPHHHLISCVGKSWRRPNCAKETRISKALPITWLPSFTCTYQHADKHPSKFSFQQPPDRRYQRNFFIAGATGIFRTKWVRAKNSCWKGRYSSSIRPTGINREEALNTSSSSPIFSSSPTSWANAAGFRRLPPNVGKKYSISIT